MLLLSHWLVTSLALPCTWKAGMSLPSQQGLCFLRTRTMAHLYLENKDLTLIPPWSGNDPSSQHHPLNFLCPLYARQPRFFPITKWILYFSVKMSWLRLIVPHECPCPNSFLLYYAHSLVSFPANILSMKPLVGLQNLNHSFLPLCSKRTVVSMLAFGTYSVMSLFWASGVISSVKLKAYYVIMLYFSVCTSCCT